MGFLDHLWDETLAGPTPDSGIGNLRKYKSLRLVRSGNNNGNTVVGNNHRISSHSILQNNYKNNSHLSAASSGPAAAGFTPSTPSTPGSPFSPTTPGGNVKKLTRRKSMHTSREPPKSPTGYDWIVLSALDR